MAKFVYIHHLEGSDWNSDISKIQRVLGHIHESPFIKTTHHELLWCSTKDGLNLNDWTLTTGNFSKDKNQFTFRLKVVKSQVILIPDQVASRTVWFFTDKKRIIVASSQRAIISLLGDFQLDKNAISWMLSCGNLGPESSWDVRVKPIIPNTSIILDKNSSEVIKIPVKSTSSNLDLEQCFDNVFSSWHRNLKCALSLSGGWDSRATARMLSKFNIRPPAYAWGFPESDRTKGSDVFVAQRVAEAINIPFQFIPLQNNSKAKRLEQFVLESEGRLDHVNSFINGFVFWENLKESNVHTVIRSDEAFGWLKVSTKQDMRVSLDINLPEDYSNLHHAFKLANIEPPNWPSGFRKAKNESLAQWRDRLYRQYRIPTILAALQEPMLSYVEILNPLLHSDFISWSISQSDRERTNKSRYKNLVRRWFDIPTATTPSIPEVQSVLLEPAVIRELKQQLSRKNAYFNFNSSFVNYILEKIQQRNKISYEKSWRQSLNSLLPFGIKKFIRHHLLGYQISDNRIALRAYIVLKMMEVIESDLK